MNSKNGWIVTFAGLGLNLALGVLYAWSVFSKQLTETAERGGFSWTKTQATLPYTVSIAFFAIMMIPAGRLQDRLGPRLVASAGALLTALGLFVTGFSTAGNTIPAMIGFGILTGIGLGLGYAASTPAAVKWFPPERKGLITGIVVSGFGIAPVYIAPLSKYLLCEYGISSSFRILGLLFAITGVMFAQLLKNPEISQNKKNNVMIQSRDMTYFEVLKTKEFYLLYIQFAFAATAGLMIIGHLARIVAVQSGGMIQSGFVLVALMAVFNAGGRIIAGVVSDRIGRQETLAFTFVSQAAVMYFFPGFSTVWQFGCGAAVAGFNYGACLSLFPSAAADYWGTKNLGMNYGVLFTAWGVGGVFGPVLGGRIADVTGSYYQAYRVSSGLMILAVIIAGVTWNIRKKNSLN